MNRLQRSILCLVMGLALASVSCGPFNACVKPYTSQITWTGTASELGEVVAQFLLCDGGLNAAEIPACAVQSLDTLAMSLGPDGTAIVNCIIAYYETNGSPVLQVRAKAVGAKRGVSPAACNGLPMPSREIGARHEPSRGPAAISSSACDSKRGARDGLSTPSGCYRWVASRTDWRASRWVALR